MSYTRTIGCVWQYDCASKIFSKHNYILAECALISVCVYVYAPGVKNVSRNVCFFSKKKKKKMRNLAVL